MKKTNPVLVMAQKLREQLRDMDHKLDHLIHLLREQRFHSSLDDLRS